MGTKWKEIAEYAGISESTVGVILSGRGDRYSKVTQQKVYEAVKKFSYKPNIAARGLRLNRSFLAGALISSDNTHMLADIIRGLQVTLSEKDYSPIVFCHKDSMEEKNCLRNCLHRSVDGLIVNAHLNSDGTINASRYGEFIEKKVPIVEILGRFLEGVPKVLIDNVVAGHLATEHLIGLGHQRIAILMHENFDESEGLGSHFDAWDRYCGYKQALTEAGLETIILRHESEGTFESFYKGGFNSLNQILIHPQKPTALVCYEDMQAYGLTQACQQQGVKVPDELSIVGYRDIDVMEVANPHLTSLEVPSREIGSEAACMLLQMINGDSVQDVKISSKLVVRQSTAPPRGAES